MRRDSDGGQLEILPDAYGADVEEELAEASNGKGNGAACQGQCYFCVKWGHCAAQRAPGSTVTCYHFGQPGHRMAQSSARRTWMSSGRTGLRGRPTATRRASGTHTMCERAVRPADPRGTGALARGGLFQCVGGQVMRWVCHVVVRSGSSTGGHAHTEAPTARPQGRWPRSLGDFPLRRSVLHAMLTTSLPHTSSSDYASL